MRRSVRLLGAAAVSLAVAAALPLAANAQSSPAASPNASQPGASPSGSSQSGPSITADITFAAGSAVLRPKDKQALNTLALTLSDPSFNPYHFRIEGHTDTVGTPDSNLTLSQKRAQAVVDYLVQQRGIDPKRLQPVGVGQEGLLINTPAQTSDPRNRRVLVVSVSN